MERTDLVNPVNHVGFALPRFDREGSRRFSDYDNDAEYEYDYDPWGHEGSPID